MADRTQAVYHQDAFFGGEWSPLAQGRSTQAPYKTAMNVCLNGIPVEQGAWVRRSGTQYIGPTSARERAKVLPFHTSGSFTIVMVVAENWMRFLVDTDWLTTLDDQVIDDSSSASGILSITTTTAHGWSVGDACVITLADDAEAEAGLFLNRILSIATVPDTDELTLKDDVGDAFSFDIAANALNGCTIKRIKQFLDTDFAEEIVPYVRVAQASDEVFFLEEKLYPKSLPITDVDGIITFGSLGDVDFVDGPYMEPQTIVATGAFETGTASGYSGTITFTPGVTTFDSDDVGRLVRLFHEPAAWNSGTTYSYGNMVTYEGKWWRSIGQGTYATSNLNIIPGTLATISGSQVALWAPALEAGRWAWGTISAQASTSCTVVLETALNSANSLTITEWRLGVYKIDRYPTCGTFHDGRLILAGAIANRVDASKSNQPKVFSPTDEYGNVDDDHAIGMQLNFEKNANIAWVASDPRGVLVGTGGGEILIHADGGITPFNREATPVTYYGCADIDPVRVGTASVFVKIYRKQIIEHRPGNYTTKFEGEYLNSDAKHLTDSVIDEMAYQHETSPALWCRHRDGSLSGITYKRMKDTDYISGAHRHEIADGSRRVASLTVGGGITVAGDYLYLVTYEPDDDDLGPGSGTDFAVEVMRPLLHEED